MRTRTFALSLAGKAPKWVRIGDSGFSVLRGGGAAGRQDLAAQSRSATASSRSVTARRQREQRRRHLRGRGDDGHEGRRRCGQVVAGRAFGQPGRSLSRQRRVIGTM